MLSRIRRAFIPKDPLYRRESGAGRRVVLVAKLVGLAAVAGVYAAWSLWMILSVHSPANWLVAWCSRLFCVLAFIFGLRSVCGEVSGGTAEALVLTPLARRRLVLAKLVGGLEFLPVAALLLPLYCVEKFWGWSLDVSPFLAGGLLRGNPHGLLDFSITSVLVGLLGFVGDLAWYALFASCGMLAAVWRRGRSMAWLSGLFLALGLFVLFTLYDSMVCGQLVVLAGKLGVSAFVGPVRSWNLGAISLVFVGVSIAVRVWVAWRFLRLAAKHFDRIATD